MGPRRQYDEEEEFEFEDNEFLDDPDEQDEDEEDEEDEEDDGDD